MKQSVSIKKVKRDAEEIFRLGGFYCSEAIVSSIRKNIDPDMPVEMVSAASGFPIGVGRSKCMCGAISGAVLALGYFLGRSDGEKDDDKCKKACFELQESFRKNHKGVLCCHVHIKGMDMVSGEHRSQCIRFTGECAAKAAEIIARELKLAITD